MAQTANPAGAAAPPSETAADDADVDNIAQVTAIRRVDSIGMVMVPIHREPEPPKPHKAERRGVALTLKPFTPPAKVTRMSTMSDLTDQTNPVNQRDIARVKDRHFSSKPRPTEPATGDHRRPTEPGQEGE